MRLTELKFRAVKCLICQSIFSAIDEYYLLVQVNALTERQEDIIRAIGDQQMYSVWERDLERESLLWISCPECMDFRPVHDGGVFH